MKTTPFPLLRFLCPALMVAFAGGSGLQAQVYCPDERPFFHRYESWDSPHPGFHHRHLERWEENYLEDDFLVQNQRYGYQPESVPRYSDVDPGGLTQPQDERFFLDRFGRRFKVFRAKPYRPGEDSDGTIWTDPRSTVPSVPRVEEDPLEALRSPGSEPEDYPRAEPYREEANRYPYRGGSEPIPDLSQYPKPPTEPEWQFERPGRESPYPGPDLQASPNREPDPLPPVARRPETDAAPLPQPPPWERPAVEDPNREREIFPREERMDRTLPGREEIQPPMTRNPLPPAPSPPPEVEKDPFEHLPYGKPVPGKKGFVTLEEHPNLPEIDVRGIAPGTPVEFPDPRDPDKLIQFRVPKP